jgi:hypothetical protein
MYRILIDLISSPYAISSSGIVIFSTDWHSSQIFSLINFSLFSSHTNILSSFSINDHLSSHLLEGLQPAKFVIDSSYRSSSMEGTDEDIERGLNLWQNIDDVETTYYKTSWEDRGDALKPKVLIVGDSYAWGVVNRGVLSHSYMDGEFWYYNQVVHGPKYLETEDFGGKPFEVHDVHNNSDLIYALNNFDAIVLLSTDANLHVFPFEFGLIK